MQPSESKLEPSEIQGEPSETKAEPSEAKVAIPTKPSESRAKLEGFIGIIAVGVGNIAGIVTHVDQIREFVSKTLGPVWLYRLHNYFVYGASLLLLIGYASLTYWLYINFVSRRSRALQGLFFICAFFTVGSTVFGSYEFLFKEVNAAPTVRKQISSYIQTILSQEVETGESDGGFRFSQAGISNDEQAWTTAQCLTALLYQEPASISDAGPAIRRAFEYLERSRLRESGEGWGYMKGIKWGVTEIDAWIALAYISSLHADYATLIWKKEELAEVLAKTHSVLDLLLKRQHDDGGWSVIEKTSNQRHLRTYSTIMAVWALTEAEKNGDILAGHENVYSAAVTRGAKWLFETYTTSDALGFSGWWPNPSARSLQQEYPGLTAQTLFVLYEVKRSHSFVSSDPRYKNAIDVFVKLSLEGNDNIEPLATRQLRSNEQAPDSDRYLEARSETAEQSTFLWYPWTLAMAVALERDPTLQGNEHEQLQKLLSVLLRRVDEEDNFVRKNEVIYPTAEGLFAEGYFLSKSGLTLAEK
jgi:hypothetical protein